MVITWRKENGLLYAVQIKAEEVRMMTVFCNVDKFCVRIDIDAVKLRPNWEPRYRCDVGNFRTEEWAENALREIALDVANGEDNVLVELEEDGVKLVQHKQPANG